MLKASVALLHKRGWCVVVVNELHTPYGDGGKEFSDF